MHLQVPGGRNPGKRSGFDRKQVPLGQKFYQKFCNLGNNLTTRYLINNCFPTPGHLNFFKECCSNPHPLPGYPFPELIIYIFRQCPKAELPVQFLDQENKEKEENLLTSSKYVTNVTRCDEVVWLSELLFAATTMNKSSEHHKNMIINYSPWELALSNKVFLSNRYIKQGIFLAQSKK